MAGFGCFMFKWLYGSMLFAKSDRLGTYAAALAYCFVLSLIPFLVVTFTIASHMGFDLSGAYQKLLADIIPADINLAQVVTTIERSSHGKNLITIGFIFALYTSYNLMTQIVRTLLFIFDDPRRSQGWEWSHWVKSAVLFGIWMVLLVVISICFVITPVIKDLLRQYHLDSRLWTLPLILLQDTVAVVAVLGAFFLTFLLVPTKRPSMTAARDGSLVAACGWILCSVLFTTVLSKMWNTNSVYEALGSVVVVLLWAQACAWSVILGACWIVRFSSRS